MRTINPFTGGGLTSAAINRFAGNQLRQGSQLIIWITKMSIVLLLAGFGLDGYSQGSLDSLLSKTRANSKALITARNQYEVEVMETRSGNTPDNPEVEYAYLWGNPEQTGNRVDFSVTQSFDFPTAYSSRSKLSKINRGQAALRLKATEQQLMANARQVWVMAVYLNNKEKLLAERLENAQLIAGAFQRMYAEGETDQLQFNQSRLKVTALTNEYKRLQMDVVENNARLSQLNGGEAFVVHDSVFPAPAGLVLDSLIAWYGSGTRNAIFKTEVEKMEQQKEVAFNSKLPKLKAGYYQETILGTQLKGITAGITIPLWENANKVKAARAGMVFAQSDAARFDEQQELQIRQQYAAWAMLRTQVVEMQALLGQSNNDELLLKALESGEISLTQYYYESDFYFQNRFDLLDLQRDLYLDEAALLRVTY